MSEERRREKKPAGWFGTDRAALFIPIALTAIYLVGAVLAFDGTLTTNGDNAQFLILGESIATGRGLSHVNEPDPSPHVKYPFFFPAVLGLFHMIAPGNYTLPKILVLLFGAGAVYMAGRAFLRKSLPIIAVPAGLLLAVNPHILDFSHQVMSEIPYLFFSFLALYLFHRWDTKRSSVYLLGASAAAYASYFTRSIGIALVCALFLFLLFRRRFREAAVFLLVFIVLAGAWTVRNHRVAEGDSYTRQFFMINPYHPERGDMTFRHFIQGRMATNATKYGAYEIGRAIIPHVYLNHGITLSGGRPVLSVCVALLFLSGLVLQIRKQIGAIEIYTILYFGACLAWPEVWASIRFLIPILPILIFYSIRAVHFLFSLAGERPAQIGIGVVTLLLLCSAVQTDARMNSAPRGYHPVWQNYFAIAEWASENTDESDIFCCRKPYLFYLHSGRRTTVYLWDKDRDKVYDKMWNDGTDYVVVAQLARTTHDYLLPVINKYSDCFEVVLRYSRPDAYLLRMLENNQP